MGTMTDRQIVEKSLADRAMGEQAPGAPGRRLSEGLGMSRFDPRPPETMTVLVDGVEQTREIENWQRIRPDCPLEPQPMLRANEALVHIIGRQSEIITEGG